MNVAGPSRVPPSGRLAPRGRVESTYEEDLLGLLSQLSLDEMDEMQTFFTHRAHTGDPLSDHDVAMNDLLQQARALAVFNQDRVLAQSIAAGEDVVVGQGLGQRPGAVPQPTGNGTAVQRNGNQHAAQAVRNNTAPSQTWGGWFSSMVDWAFGSQPVPQPGPTNASTAVPKAPVVNRPTGHDCVICQDPIRGAEVRAPCGHYYGIDCVTDLFQSATRDETLFPPRCCRQNIPLAQVQPHLSQTLITTFQQKQVEFSTLKRVYCSSPTCSRFLGPLSEGIFASKAYTCPAPGCGRRTCTKCREQYSGDWSHACRPDADAAQILELSRASGWARCPGCSQMIELNMGCFHMTCRCRTEFCYLCRARWKSCRCPQWDERRLLAAAEERVDAQLGVGREQGARRDVPAQRAGPVPVPANRAPLVRLGGRPLVPAPVPVPAPRPVPAPVRPLAPARPPVVQALYPQPTPARAPVPAPRPVPPPAPVRPLAPARPPVVQVQYAQPTPARAPTTSSSTGRPANTTSTRPREAANHTVESWRSTLPASAFAPTRTSTNTAGTSASTSTPTPSSVRPKSTHNPDPMRQRLVHEMMERLRVDHDCDHTRWRYRSGGGICQTCGHHLPLYLYRCQGCEMLACKRCKHNRL